VTLTVEPRGRGLRFSVRDSGPGIAPDALSRLFQPFSQLEASTSRLFGGTGLGLSISRELAQLMGGTLSVESTLGVGSPFSFDVELQESTPAQALPALQPPLEAAPERSTIDGLLSRHIGAGTRTDSQ